MIVLSDGFVQSDGVILGGRLRRTHFNVAKNQQGGKNAVKGSGFVSNALKDIDKKIQMKRKLNYLP